MRGVRKEEKVRDERRQQLNLPEHVQLLPESKEDALLASAQTYGGDFRGAWKHSRRAIGRESIFSQGAVAAAATVARGKQKKRPASSAAAAAAAAPAGIGKDGWGGGAAAQKQRRLAPNVKLRLSNPDKA